MGVRNLMPEKEAKIPLIYPTKRHRPSTVSQINRPDGLFCSSTMCATSPAAREITAKPSIAAIGTQSPPATPRQFRSH